jgi:hypothetical protein
MDIVQMNEKLNFQIEKNGNFENLKNYFKNKQVVRFAIFNNELMEAEYAELTEQSYNYKNIFNFNPRKNVNNSKFNAIMIVPTGIGANVGGDSGDANAAAKLIASTVDTLITHPNVVNAADMNEMTENTLYVEGSILNRFITGQIGLSPTRGNRILLISDKSEHDYISNYTINTASAARVVLGADIDVVQIEKPPKYYFYYNENNMAVGKVNNLENLIEIVEKYKNDYDSIVLHTLMEGDSDELFDNYFNDNLNVNPWGGIESMLTHSISNLSNVSIAHAPMFYESQLLYKYGIVNPKKCAETLSKTELFCVIKGLFNSPKIVNYSIEQGILTNQDVHVLITPERAIGIPLLAALEQNITVISVKDNNNVMKNNLKDLPWRQNQLIEVNNYLEAAGVLIALKNKISPNTVLRPIKKTTILNGENNL